MDRDTGFGLVFLVFYSKGLASLMLGLDSAMRRSSLYFATRSERDMEPVLIWPVPSPTARWAMVVSSVSPER